MIRIIPSTRRPDISFRDNGQIDITANLARLLDIHQGDVLNIVIKDREWYLYVANRADAIVGRHEAQCFPTSKRSNHFRLYSRSLTSAVLTQCGGVSRADLPVGALSLSLGFPAVPIIIKNNLYKP